MFKPIYWKDLKPGNIFMQTESKVHHWKDLKPGNVFLQTESKIHHFFVISNVKDENKIAKITTLDQIAKIYSFEVSFTQMIDYRFYEIL